MNAKLENWSSKINLRKIQKTYGSPLWIVSKPKIIENIKLLVQFTGERNRILFPIKANPSLTVMEVLAQQGIGADCASKKEIDLALYAGIQFCDISYNSPIQDVKLCVDILQNEGNVVMDDPDAIFELQEALKNKEFKGKIWLRINPQSTTSYSKNTDNQDLMAHGENSSKFGIPVENLKDILKKLTLLISGLHIHVGTQMDNIESFLYAIDNLHSTADLISSFGHKIENINIGGGLGIPFTEEDIFPSLQQFIASTQKAKKSCYNYFIEPGHSLIGNSVGLLTTVKSIKKSRGKKWVITDAGTNQLAKITLLRWPHQVLDPNNTPLPMSGPDALAGPLCFEGDILLPKTDLSNIKREDPLFVKTVGAYTHSLANGFNGRNSPGWVLLNKNNETSLKTLKENSNDDLGISRHFWKKEKDPFQEKNLDANLIEDLSSIYLKEMITNDSYQIISFTQTSERNYKIHVKITSDINFVSMPTAIRIIGNAAIIGFLDLKKETKKVEPIWAKKLVLDCFKIIPVNEEFIFSLNYSAELKKAKVENVRVIYFNTLCGKFSGTFILNQAIT